MNSLSSNKRAEITSAEAILKIATQACLHGNSMLLALLRKGLLERTSPSPQQEQQMKTSKAILLSILAAVSLSIAACETTSIGEGGKIAEQTAKSCRYEDNLDLTADQFISKCCKSKIRREFSGEYYGRTLREIAKDRSKDGKKANKLLRQERFRK